MSIAQGSPRKLLRVIPVNAVPKLCLRSVDFVLAGVCPGMANMLTSMTHNGASMMAFWLGRLQMRVLIASTGGCCLSGSGKSFFAKVISSWIHSGIV